MLPDIPKKINKSWPGKGPKRDGTTDGYSFLSLMRSKSLRIISSRNFSYLCEWRRHAPFLFSRGGGQSSRPLCGFGQDTTFVYIFYFLFPFQCLFLIHFLLLSQKFVLCKLFAKQITQKPGLRREIEIWGWALGWGEDQDQSHVTCFGSFLTEIRTSYKL